MSNVVLFRPRILTMGDNLCSAFMTAGSYNHVSVKLRAATSCICWNGSVHAVDLVGKSLGIGEGNTLISSCMECAHTVICYRIMMVGYDTCSEPKTAQRAEPTSSLHICNSLDLLTCAKVLNMPMPRLAAHMHASYPNLKLDCTLISSAAAL